MAIKHKIKYEGYILYSFYYINTQKPLKIEIHLFRIFCFFETLRSNIFKRKLVGHLELLEWLKFD